MSVDAQRIERLTRKYGTKAIEDWRKMTAKDRDNAEGLRVWPKGWFLEALKWAYSR